MKDNARIKKLSLDLSNEIIRKIDQHAGDSSFSISLLQDLKLIVVRKAAEISGWNTDTAKGMDLVWELARNMPDFTKGMAHERRISAISLAVAVLLGWLLGGFLSGILGFFSLGGDILRAAAIFITVWLEDYFAVNVSARKYILKIFGWTALAGVASGIVSGVLRFSGGLRILFPAGLLKAGFFRSIWLIFGLFVVFVFFSGKRGNVDRKVMQKNLEEEIFRQLHFICFVFEQVEIRERRLQSMISDAPGTNSCAAGECEIVKGVMELMDSLNPSQKLFLKRKLEKQGFRQADSEETHLIWDQERDEKLYESVGFIKNGDSCLVLRKPMEYNGTVTPGLVQRMD